MQLEAGIGWSGVLLVACLLSGVAMAQDAAFSSRCTWEPDALGGTRCVPAFDAASCEARASTRDVYIGQVDDTAELEALPTDDCVCGEFRVNIGFYDPGFGGQCCYGPTFSCSKPGSGCMWGSYVEWHRDVATASECRATAQQCGAYYGFEGGANASEPPDGECVCGETRAHWFFDWAPVSPSGYGGLHCGVWRHQCWAPVWDRTAIKRYRELLRGQE